MATFGQWHVPPSLNGAAPPCHRQGGRGLLASSPAYDAKPRSAARHSPNVGFASNLAMRSVCMPACDCCHGAKAWAPVQGARPAPRPPRHSRWGRCCVCPAEATNRHPNRCLIASCYGAPCWVSHCAPALRRAGTSPPGLCIWDDKGVRGWNSIRGAAKRGQGRIGLRFRWWAWPSPVGTVSQSSTHETPPALGWVNPPTCRSDAFLLLCAIQLVH